MDSGDTVQIQNLLSSSCQNAIGPRYSNLPAGLISSTVRMEVMRKVSPAAEKKVLRRRGCRETGGQPEPQMEVRLVSRCSRRLLPICRGQKVPDTPSKLANCDQRKSRETNVLENDLVSVDLVLSGTSEKGNNKYPA